MTVSAPSASKERVAASSVLDSRSTVGASAAAANINNASAVAGVNEGIAGIAGNCRLIGIRHGGIEERYAETYLWAAGFDPGGTTPGFPAQLARGADVITSSFSNFPALGVTSMAGIPASAADCTARRRAAS